MEIEQGYPLLEMMISKKVETLGQLFTTDATNLFATYLSELPSRHRKHYTCMSCKDFIDRYMCLVEIDSDGNQEPWIPTDVPSFFRNAFAAMHYAVKHANVTGVFVSEDTVWGKPVTGIWTHLCGNCQRVHEAKALTANQKMAFYKEEYNTLCRALVEINMTQAHVAVQLLQSEEFRQTNVAFQAAKWFLALKEKLGHVRGESRKSRIIWKAVATAPTGYCHPRNNMVGTLYEDIMAGKSFADIKAAWDKKMNPLKYQRPQAPPKAGNIVTAEKLVKKLDIESSLQRRYARFDECQFIWKPAEILSGTVFGHLKGRSMPSRTMSWHKFQRDVLPGAQEIKYFATGAPAGYYGLTTAAIPDSQPILQWDAVGDVRNPVSWYYYDKGSIPRRWGLESGWNMVNGIMLKPQMWQKPDWFPHITPGVFLVLDRAMDILRPNSNAIFPSNLRKELHEVRATIEAYSKSAQLTGTGDANGISFENAEALRLLVDGNEVTIDRWE